MMIRQLHIDVFFDFICPWCLIGKRQLLIAINRFYQLNPRVKVVVRWRGVQLIPDLPIEGVPFQAFYLKRLGSLTTVHMRQEQVNKAANQVGLKIDFERIKRMPNTAKAHRLFEKALNKGSPEQCNMLLEQLFSAYFYDGLDIGNTITLSRIAKQCGFSSELIKSALIQDHEDFISASTGGNGVPYFIFDSGSALVGAQSADALYQVMREALVVQGELI